MISGSPLPKDDEIASIRFLKQIEINQALTALYCIVEVGRSQIAASKDSSIRQAISMSIDPSSATLLMCEFGSRHKARLFGIFDSDNFEVEMGRHLSAACFKGKRGIDSKVENILLTRHQQLLLLFWKTILLLFGSTKELEESKVVLREASDEADDEHGEGFITASPLDYHLFRQEITSKYPAYSPPPPLVPIELENNSILPPLPNHPSRRASQESLQLRAGANVNGTAGSIFNQPVHIATPAPSPPPSPAGPGGKGGKKQNYQTNQNFPFLYPPLDASTGVVGGKGSVTLQDRLIERRWDGNDVPASILEAGQLFASRMRMSRSIRQLWDVREKFIKYERGWNEASKAGEVSDAELSEANEEGEEPLKEAVKNSKEPQFEKETDNRDVQRRLDAVELFYVCT